MSLKARRTLGSARSAGQRSARSGVDWILDITRYPRAFLVWMPPGRVTSLMLYDRQGKVVIGPEVQSSPS
jgi:hypothetical protein